MKVKKVTTIPTTPSERARSIFDILTEATKVVRTAWTRDAIARNKTNRTTVVDDVNAVTFCSIGAINYITPCTELQEGAYSYLISAIENSSIASWNDQHGRRQEEVVEAFERATEIAKQRLLPFEPVLDETTVLAVEDKPRAALTE